jgi:hypothetical protein
VSHSSMLKARRRHQKNRKLLDNAAKEAKRVAKQGVAESTGEKRERIKAGRAEGEAPAHGAA